MPATKDNLLVISGVAQRKRVGLITRRSVDRNHSPLKIKIIKIIKIKKIKKIKYQYRLCAYSPEVRIHPFQG